MPSTWTAYARRKSICQAEGLDIPGAMNKEYTYHCLNGEGLSWKDLSHVNIAEGEIIVRVRETTKTVDFHPQCWWKIAIEIMKLTPYSKINKGRRKLDISDEARTTRRKLSSRYSAFQTRINNYRKRIMLIDPNSDDLRISVSIMSLKQDQLWFEMRELGGAPEKWRVPDGQRIGNVVPAISD